MQKIFFFIKTTLSGGLLVVLPAWLTMLLLVKVLMKMEAFVKPVSSHLPQEAAHPQIIAILLLLALCFAVGAILRTAIGRQMERALEDKVLSHLPGYRTLRSVAQQMADIQDDRGFKPALIEIEEAWLRALLSRSTRASGLRFSFRLFRHPRREHSTSLPPPGFIRCMSR